MLAWREGVVTAVTGGWPGAVLLEVSLTDGEPVPALAYPQLVGDPAAGDRVLLNVNAYALGLGTGGYALVIALPDRLPPDAPSPDDPLVKARYTPHQVVVATHHRPTAPQTLEAQTLEAQTLEAQTLEARTVAAQTVEELAGMPVVVADLHSALPAIVAGALAAAGALRIAYVMTDWGALPVWFSRTVAALRPRLATVITTGQSFGGDIEAVNIHSGLLAARDIGADVAVVAPGPGNLGTGTRWGFSGTGAGDAVNAVSVLGGFPVGAVRLSAADPRPRHRGVSHHSLTAFGLVALARADLVVPRDLPADLAVAVESALAGLSDRHRIVRVGTAWLIPALRAIAEELSTMGRDLDADPWYFRTAAAAGAHAAALSHDRWLR